VQMSQNLEGMGFTVVPFGQGYKDMSPPTKELMKLVLEERIAHGGNEPLRWMMDNIYIKPTQQEIPKRTRKNRPSVLTVRSQQSWPWIGRFGIPIRAAFTMSAASLFYRRSDGDFQTQ